MFKEAIPKNNIPINKNSNLLSNGIQFQSNHRGFWPQSARNGRIVVWSFPILGYQCCAKRYANRDTPPI